jgi:hypothetical protein
LLNLTFPTPVSSDLSLEEIFRYAKAKFKLYVPGKFCCFSRSSETVNRLKKNQRYVLEFDFQQQKFRVPAGIKVLLKKNPKYEFTYWHNFLFNPHLSPDVIVLGFEPDWLGASSDPTALKS